MRKTSLIFLGALAGVVATLLLTQPHTLLMGSAARAAASDTYRELNLFGDVFERVRADYVEKPDDSRLVESAINGTIRASFTFGSACVRSIRSRRLASVAN